MKHLALMFIVLSCLALSASAAHRAPVDFTGVFVKTAGTSGQCPDRLDVTLDESTQAVTLPGLALFDGIGAGDIVQEDGDSDFFIREKRNTSITRDTLVQERTIWKFARPSRPGSTVFRNLSWTVSGDIGSFEAFFRVGDTFEHFFCNFQKQ